MGCTTSKQGFGNKKREHVASWYNPLPRSVSARPYIDGPPCEPPVHTFSQTFEVEDPAIAGSFIRLLHKKKSLSPSSAGHQPHFADRHGHVRHRHNCHPHLPQADGTEVLNADFTKKNALPSLDCNHETWSIGDDYEAASFQQLQLAKLNSTYKQKLAKTSEGDLAMADQASHFDDLADDAPSFRYYREHSSLSKDMCPALERVRDDMNGNGDDEHMHVINDHGITGGLRQRRKSRFAPKPASVKAHHTKTKSTEKSLSFNVSLDDGFAETGSPAWPRYTLEEQGISLRKRKNSSDFLDLNSCLDGLEVQLKDKLCDRAPSNAEHPQTKGFSEVESPTDIDSDEPNYGGTQSSAFNADVPGGSQLSTPFRSPIRSPAMSSLKSSSSPLFDPSLLAAFEEAVESVRYSAPDDGWMLVDDDACINEPSSLSSSDKFTWISSEPSSDAESARNSDEIFYNNLHQGSFVQFLHDQDSNTKRQKVDGIFSDLDKFELRCPPKGEDKIVLYFTSLRGVRKTYQDCCALRLILQGLGVDVDERDVWMHLQFREELADLLGERALPVPRLFIKGRYIGGVEEVKQLHEDGLLVRLIEDLPTFRKFRRSCDGCADVRFIPCLTCRGSRKLLDDALDQMVKCFQCNENGLIMCPMCRS